MKAVTLLFLIFIVSILVGAVQAPSLDHLLREQGIVNPRVSSDNEAITITFDVDIENMDSEKFLGQVTAIMQTVVEKYPEKSCATLLIHFSDGEIMDITGNPSDFRKGMTEEEFLMKAGVRFLTRGPPITPRYCNIEEGMNCQSNPDECPCEPGYICDPSNTQADKWGCILVYTPKNAHLFGSKYVCNLGYEWGPGGLDCIPIPRCGESAFGFQGECYCIQGYEWNPDGTECILKEIPTEVFTGLTFESHSKPSGSSLQIPLTLNGIEDKIGNMDITLNYDSSVLEATEVTKGDLTTDSLFEYNILEGTILISLADADGFSGNGSIAYVTFNVIGAAGSTSPLQIAALAANQAEDYEVLTIPTNDGVFRVIFISTEESGGLTISVSDTTGAKGSTVEVPINLEGASEVGSMDIFLNYDANVLSAVYVEAGALGKNALIESNTANDGDVILALADSSGIDGDGAVAIVAFEVIGDAGTTSYLTLEEVSVHNLDLAEIIPNTECGTFLVI